MILLHDSFFCNLLLDEILIHTVVNFDKVVTHGLLSIHIINVCIELRLFSLTHTLKLLYIIKVPSKGLFSDHTVNLSSSFTFVNCVVIHSKWTLRLHELWQSCVIVMTNLLSIKSILDYLSLVLYI